MDWGKPGPQAAKIFLCCFAPKFLHLFAFSTNFCPKLHLANFGQQKRSTRSSALTFEKESSNQGVIRQRGVVGHWGGGGEKFVGSLRQLVPCGGPFMISCYYATQLGFGSLDLVLLTVCTTLCEWLPWENSNLERQHTPSCCLYSLLCFWSELLKMPHMVGLSNPWKQFEGWNVEGWVEFVKKNFLQNLYLAPWMTLPIVTSPWLWCPMPQNCMQHQPRTDTQGSQWGAKKIDDSKPLNIKVRIRWNNTSGHEQLSKKYPTPKARCIVAWKSKQNQSTYHTTFKKRSEQIRLQKVWIIGYISKKNKCHFKCGLKKTEKNVKKPSEKKIWPQCQKLKKKKTNNGEEEKKQDI